MSAWKERVHERCGNCCQICGRTDKLTVQHKRPISRGGKNNPENTVTWCVYCHRAYHSEHGNATSDDFGNPIGEDYDPNRKKKGKRTKKRHRR